MSLYLLRSSRFETKPPTQEKKNSNKNKVFQNKKKCVSDPQVNFQ
jgi:hypothetical protein